MQTFSLKNITCIYRQDCVFHFRRKLFLERLFSGSFASMWYNNAWRACLDNGADFTFKQCSNYPFAIRVVISNGRNLVIAKKTKQSVITSFKIKLVTINLNLYDYNV